MAKIRQISKKMREEVKQSMGQLQMNLKSKLHDLTRALQESREAQNYTEAHLKYWTIQLKNLQQQLEQPPTIQWCHDQDEISRHITMLQLQTLLSFVTAKSQWSKNGRTVAGGHGQGDSLYQINEPYGMDIDDDGTLLIADMNNHRIVRWKTNAKSGEIIAGGKDQETTLINWINRRPFSSIEIIKV